MKSPNPKALTTRLLVALALTAVSVAGLSGLAEAATCYTCHAPVGSSTDLRPVESTYRNITTGSIRGSHLKHIPAATTLVSACVACHGGAGGVTSYTTKHRNGNLDVPLVGYLRDGSAQTGNPVPLGTCSTASCHATSHNTTYVPTPTWGVTSGCVGCHTGAGAFTASGGPNTGSHTKHLAASATCGNCHTGAVAGTSGGNAHVDGNIDVVAAGYAASNVVKHTAGSGYSTCATAGGAACHVSQFGTGTIPTTVWGAADCGACHLNGGAVTPTTGSHTKHTATGAQCFSCHANAIAGVSGGLAHRDGNIDVTNVGYLANVTKHTAGSGYRPCSSASCHASPYGTDSSPTPTWGVSGAGGCVSCHNSVGAFTASGGPGTGSHTKHLANSAACGDCHDGVTANVNGGTAHGDTNIDVTGTLVSGYTVNVTKHTANVGYVGTCLTTSNSCHSSPYSTSSAGPSATWGSAGCISCHNGAGALTGAGGRPSTGSHSKHTAICASCHTGAIAGVSGGTAHPDTNIDVAVTSYPTNITKHTINSGYTSSCTTSCHGNPYNTTPGTTPNWGTPGPGCGACHNSTGAFTGAGSSPNTGSHSKHMAANAAYNCAHCHDGAISGLTGGLGHGDDNIDVTGGYTTNIVKHSINVGYKRCSTASCHADPYKVGGFTTSPTWGISSSCGECHVGVGSFSGTNTSPVTGSHTRHQAGSANCTDCHAGAIAGITGGGTAHIDGNIDVTVSNYTANVTKHTANIGFVGTCTTTCHASPYTTSAGTTSAWGSVGCISCHNGAGALTAGGRPATGSHTKHTAVCASCHTGAIADVTGGTAHRDTNIDIAGTYVTNYTANVTKHTINTGYNSTCTTSCHGNAYNTVAGTTPTWGSAGSGCGACHTGAGAFTGTNSSPNTGSHTKHMVNPAYTCGHCHDGAVSGSTGGLWHGDNNIDVIGGYTPNIVKHSAGSGYRRCSTASCHADPYKVVGFTTSPTWGVSSSCGECHIGIGAFSGTGSVPFTGSHSRHQVGITCDKCHAGAVAGSSGGIDHIDGNIDVFGGYLDNVTKHTANTGYRRCSSASCHADPYSVAGFTTSPTWGVSSTCGECHVGIGAFSGTNSVPFTGSHSKHQGSITCDQCHLGAVAGISGGGTTHIDGNIDVTGSAVSGYTANVTKHAANSGYTSCSTTSAACHANPFSTSTAASPTPVWGSVSAACVACHNGVGAFTGGLGSAPATGSHSKHSVQAVECVSCHTGAVQGVTGGNFHFDGNIDVITGLGYPANRTKHTAGSAYSSCATAGCHGTATWGGTLAVSCRGCHTALVAADFVRPSRHVSNGTATDITTDYDCIVCHAEGVAQATGVAKSTLHTGTTTTAGNVDLRNVDSVDTTTGGGSAGTNYWAWPHRRASADLAKGATNTTNRNNMDTYCLNCHDANGSSGIAVNNSNTGLILSGLNTTIRTVTGAGNSNTLNATVAQRPFNTLDTLQNNRDKATTGSGTTFGAFRLSSYGRVLNVKSQFNSGNLGTTNWASHHNLNQYTKRYNTNSTVAGTGMLSTSWTAYVTKENVTMNSATGGAIAGLHCSDCHLNEVNAHGAANSWYMLNGTSISTDVDVTGLQDLDTNQTAEISCLRCHSHAGYAQGGTSTIPRISHNSRCNSVEATTGTSIEAPFGATCHACHGGYGDATQAVNQDPVGSGTVKVGRGGLGSIHGTDEVYYPNTGATSSKRYRFMSGGSMRFYGPNGATYGSTTSWEASTGMNCYTLSSAEQWGSCTTHSGGGAATTIVRARKLSY